MKKPYKLDERKGNSGIVTIVYDEEEASHADVLYQAVTGLAKAGFAPEKEILEEWKVLIEIELENI